MLKTNDNAQKQGSMNRRSFLKSSAAVGAATAVASTPFVSSAYAAMRDPQSILDDIDRKSVV